jgi:two-component system sensor histidine kinase/response regulator
MNDHVTKPIDPDALFAVLIKWIKPGGRNAVASNPPPQSNGGIPPGHDRPSPEGLPGIDRVTGLRRVAGNATLYRKLLLEFHRDYASSVERIQAAMAEDRLDDAERQAHTLKAVAGNIGAMDLHRVTQELDSALRQIDLKKAGALMADVERELSVVVQSLKPLAEEAVAAQANCQNAEVTSGAVVDRAALEMAMGGLAELLRKNNPDAENALEDLRRALRGERAQEVERIAQALDRFDFRGATKALACLADAEGITLAVSGT